MPSSRLSRKIVRRCAGNKSMAARNSRACSLASNAIAVSVGVDVCTCCQSCCRHRRSTAVLRMKSISWLALTRYNQASRSLISGHWSRFAQHLRNTSCTRSWACALDLVALTASLNSASACCWYNSAKQADGSVCRSNFKFLVASNLLKSQTRYRKN